MKSFDLDAAITTWQHFLRTERAISDEDIEELVCHVQDQIDELIEDGLEPEMAFYQATRQMGSYTQLKREYKDVHWKKLRAEGSWVEELQWRVAMWRNYVKSALRTMSKHKAYTFINVAGLSLGILCCCLIILFVEYERSYDLFHENADRIVRIAEDLKTDEQMLYQDTSSPPMGPAFVEDFAEVENMVRLRFTGRLFRSGENMFQEDWLAYADSSLFDIFSFEMVRGNPQTALAEPFSIVLTETMATKYFGDGDALEQILTDEFGTAYTVTGVVKDVPDNSHMYFEGLISMVSRNAWDGDWETQWFANSHFTYLLLKEGTDAAVLEAKTPEFIERRIGDLQRRLGTGYTLLPLIPLTDIHMSDHRASGYGTTGRKEYLYVFGAVALFILIIACINFINLATARSSERAKEVGLRKVVGAKRMQLASQFLSESFIVTVLALILAIGIGWIVLPSINTFIDRSMEMTSLFSGLNAVIVVLLVVGVSLIAGGYPAAVLSRFKPVRVLKGGFMKRAKGGWFRKGLVVFQFAISMLFIVCTSVVMKQLGFLQEQNLGFTEEQVLVLNFRGDNQVKERAETIKQTFLSHSAVSSAGMSLHIPGTGNGNLYTNVEVSPGEIRNGSLNYYLVDMDFMDTYELDVIAGRGFSSAFPSDTLSSMVINKAMLARFGWATPEEALGKTFTAMGRDMQVIGVVDDFNYRSLHRQVDPLGMFIVPGAARYMSLRMTSDQVMASMGELEATWKELVPNRPFDAFFIDEVFNEQYATEQRFAMLFRVFAGIAIFIACLGLFGLTAFTVQRRTKEIGVRKVLGASISQILLLLSRDFVWLVVIAFVVSVPISYYAATLWLNEFPYRSELGVWIFLASGLIAFAIAGLTVSYQTIKAALSNPVDSMRYE